jgi:photosystem II stability/assembly factor-like uncharacterized protein
MLKVASKKSRTKEIEQIIAVQARPTGIMMVQTTYSESDAINAVGQVLKDDWDRDDAQCAAILNTNDSLSPLWYSPEGNLWVGSGRGNIYTTAKVKFQPHRMPTLVYEQPNPDFVWSVATLPDMKGKGFRPNATALWGTSDKDVWAGTFSGGIYHWDGKDWRQEFYELDSVINHIHGSGNSDVYAVGGDGVILHFDGRKWRRIPYPDDDSEGRGLTGVRALNSDEAIITGRDGRILHGNKNGMAVLGEFESEFYGVGVFKKRLFLAAGEDGVHELKGKKISVLKDTFGSVGIFETDSRIFFTEPDQREASVIEHDPKLDPPWMRRSY